MSYEASTGLGVFNQYGPRNTGNSVGVERSDDSIHQLSINLTGEMLSATTSPTIFVPPVVVPKGALFLRYRLRVDEAFALSGTSPTIEVGAVGSIATNGVVLTETELENIGTKVPASAGAGTWSTTSSTGTTAAAEVGIQREGDTVVSSTVGKATLTMEYYYKTKV